MNPKRNQKSQQPPAVASSSDPRPETPDTGAPSFLTPESLATPETCPGCGTTDFPHRDGCPHEARLAAEAMRATRARQDASPSTPQPTASPMAPAVSRALEHVATLRSILPTRAPTPEEMAEDPRALGYALRMAGEELGHLDALLRDMAQGAPGPERPFCDELLARGWMAPKLLAQPTLEAGAAVAPLQCGACAVRLSDGLLLSASSVSELLARVDAVNAAAKAGTARPWWVPEGLTLDPDTKSVRWPEPVDTSAPPTQGAAPLSEFCPDGRRHRPDHRNPRRCVNCNGWPLVVVDLESAAPAEVAHE
jgi:hypothetical protein